MVPELHLIRKKMPLHLRDSKKKEWCLSYSCVRTSTRVGSDRWWEEQDEGRSICTCVSCKDWVKGHPVERPRINWAKVNEMTIDAAIALEGHGIDGYQYNECLNVLRRMIQESLDFNGENYCPMLGHGVNWRELREKRKQG